MAIAVLLIAGFSALLYEVSWIRLLGLRLGTSPMAISTVLSAFFLGMAAGSFMADRYLSRFRYKAWILGVLQVVIGISGLIVTYELSSQQSPVGILLQSSSLWLRSLIAFAVMLPATACIGAVLPVAITAGKTPRVSIARLYAVNNVGAAAGSIATGFFLLPAIGYVRAVFASAVVSLLSGAALCLFSRDTNLQGLDTPDHSAMETATTTKPSARITFLVMLTGFGSTCLQIVLVRYFALLFDSTIYAVSAVIAANLLGFSLGSRILSFGSGLSTSLLLLGVGFLAIPTYLTLLPQFCALSVSSHGPGNYLGLMAAGFPVAILVPTMLFGRIFPLALSSGRSAYGYLCGANTLGAAASSML